MLYLLSRNSGANQTPADRICENVDFPDDCMVDFDLRLIDLFQEMARRNQTVRERIRSEYGRVKELLGKVPSRMELFMYMEDAFKKHMKDIIEYRTMEYYRRRYADRR